MKSIKLREQKFSRTVMMLLVMLLTTATAGAQDTENTEVIGGNTFNKNDQGSLLITSVDDWNNLAAAVAAGNECTGYNFVLTTDISITRPIGQQTGSNKSDRKRFAGTFDGNGNILTVNLNTADEWFSYNKGYASPFAYVKNTTIKNLHVVGTITTTGQWASGVVGSTGNNANDGNCTIDNVQVSVEIINNYTTNGGSYSNHGGFIGIPEGAATITNSWFDGKFSGNDYKYSGGFIGLNKSNSTKLTNCLFNPYSIESEMSVVGACEFVHDNSNNTHTLENCYSVTLFGAPENAQGIHVVAEQPGSDYSFTSVTAADRKIYYHITSNPAWRNLVTQFAGGGTIALEADITAGSEDNCLTVPEGKTLTLNMNGYTLDRGLFTETAKENGYVILVKNGGKLTINSGTSNGTIKGGHNSGDGGGIYVEAGGELTLTNVTVTENSINSNKVGGGVYVETDGTLYGTLYMSGTVKITNNATVTNGTSRTEKNLYLSEGTFITLNGKLTGSKTIGVTKSGNGVFTSGLQGNGNLSSFVSDNTSLRLGTVEGEAALLQPYNVTTAATINGTLAFKVNDKSATTAVLGDNITLTVTPASDDYQIASVSYSYNDGEDRVVNIEAVENVYSFTMPAADVTISATFALSNMPLILNKASLNGVTKFWGTFYTTTAYQLPEGAQAFYMKSDKSLYRVGDDGTIIPAGEAVVVMSDGDLNESSITLALTPSDDDITVTGNFLKGTASATPVADLSIESGKAVYVMSADSDGNLGFYQFTGTEIPANKAYYVDSVE